MAALLSMLMLVLSLAAHGQDLGLESRMADDMRTRDNREAVMLQADGQQFAGLYRAAIVKDHRGGILMIHDGELPPDAATLMQPLRMALPRRGWDTLSIQAPEPDRGNRDDDSLALLPKAMARIDAGLKSFEERKTSPVVLLGHGLGAVAVIRFAAERTEAKPATVVIFDPPTTTALEAAMLDDLKKIKIPLLDIVGNRTGAAMPEAALRRKRAQQENGGYRQVVVNDTRRDFRDMEETVTNLVHGWLVRSLQSEEPAEPTKPTGTAQPPQQPNRP